MLKRLIVAVLALIAVLLPSLAPAQDDAAPVQPKFELVDFNVQDDPDNILYLDLSNGRRVTIRLMPSWAPNHVARIKELTQQGFYDGVVFHRVIDGFMAQTGCPQGTGTGGSGKKLKAEFSAEKHVRGTVSMARAQSPDSADSQFFICFATASHLDGQYTVWGKVVQGMEFVDKIKKGSGGGGTVSDPDKIKQVRVLAGDELVAVAAVRRDEQRWLVKA